MREQPQTYIGVGIYTVSDAARFLRPSSTKASPQNIRRWLVGHTYRYRGERRRANPLWRPQLPKIDDTVGMGFRDLMELRFIVAFRDEMLSLQAIRFALARACEIVGHDHPFATERFQTDGKNIFLEIATETDEPTLINLLSNQYAIHRMLAPSFKDIDFKDGIAARWWPMGQRSGIVLDPNRSFGRPIDDASGIPADTLSTALATLGSVKEVVRWYEVDPGAVRAASRFTEIFAA